MGKNKGYAEMGLKKSSEYELKEAVLFNLNYFLIQCPHCGCATAKFLEHDDLFITICGSCDREMLVVGMEGE